MKSPLDDVRVTAFRLADVPFGKSLTDAEEWDTTTLDWERLVRLEPDGCFKAVRGDEDIGTTACVAFGDVAWVHSVIVRPEFRGRGVGEVLLRACLEFLERRQVSCVKLDSNPGVEPFYERFGFRREYPSFRYLREGAALRSTATVAASDDLAEICRLDRELTGVDRRRVVEAIFRDLPRSAFVVKRNGDLQGYAMVRRSPLWNSLGPCVVRNGDRAITRELVRAVLATAPGEKFRACVGGFNRPACASLERLGFRQVSYCTRMFRGAPFEESQSAVAMISAQKG